MGKGLNEEAPLWETGEFQIADAPNPHSLLYEHTKTIATLSVAFLGFSVGFAEKLVQVANFAWAPWILGGVWALLVLSIVFVLLASVGLHQYLLLPPNPTNTVEVDRYKKLHNSTSTKIGFAGIFLAAAAIAFAVFGGSVMAYSEDKIDASTAIQKATKFLSGLPQLANSQWQVDSLSLEEREKLYKVALTDQKSSTRYLVSVRKIDGETISYGPQEAKPPEGPKKESSPILFRASDIQRRLLDLGYPPGPIDGGYWEKNSQGNRGFSKRQQSFADRRSR